VPGDIGARPLAQSAPTNSSPDIIVTNADPQFEPTVLGRDEFLAIKNRIVPSVLTDTPYDVWVHVWNLGRAPAYGVRVRAWVSWQADPASGLFLGGRRLDLGDRTSESSHRVVKIGQWFPDGSGRDLVRATAEGISDVASGSSVSGGIQDRHTAFRHVPLEEMPG